MQSFKEQNEERILTPYSCDVQQKICCSGFAEIDVLCSSDVIQQTIARSCFTENCKHFKKNLTFKTTSI